MKPTTTTANSASYYAQGRYMKTFLAVSVVTGRDDDLVRIDASDMSLPDEGWGRPGIGLVLTSDEARSLAFALLSQVPEAGPSDAGPAVLIAHEGTGTLVDLDECAVLVTNRADCDSVSDAAYGARLRVPGSEIASVIRAGAR